jgi:hypothetical protein
MPIFSLRNQCLEASRSDERDRLHCNLSLSSLLPHCRLVFFPEKSTYGFYCLGIVYEEYGKSYIKLGQTQLALDYLDRAENNLSSTKLWKIMLMTARAMALVHGGEIKSGVDLANAHTSLTFSLDLKCLLSVHKHIISLGSN